MPALPPESPGRGHKAASHQQCWCNLPTSQSFLQKQRKEGTATKTSDTQSSHGHLTAMDGSDGVHGHVTATDSIGAHRNVTAMA